MTRRLAAAFGAALLLLLPPALPGCTVQTHTGIQRPVPDPYALVLISASSPERVLAVVSDPLQVRELDRRTDFLATSVPFTGGPLPPSCPADHGVVVELAFYDRAHPAPPAAPAEVVEARVGGCRLTTIRRAGQPPLVVVGGQYLDDVLGVVHVAPVVG